MSIEHELKRDVSIDLLLVTLTAFLDSNNICYAIKEFSDNSCEKQKGKFIDLFIAERDYKKVTYSFGRICTSSKFIPVQKINLSATATRYVLAYQKPDEKGLDVVRVNIYRNYIINSRLYFSTEELLKDRVYSTNRSYWTLNNIYNSVYILVKAIENKCIAEDQFHNLCECWKSASTAIKSYLKRYFNDESINTLADSLDNRNLNDLMDNIELLTRNFKLSDSNSFSKLFLRNMSLLKGDLKPPGVVVGILGRDGSGKSTFVNEITKSLGGCFNNTTTFKRHPKVFYKELIFKKEEDYHFSKPHLYKERGYVASFLKLNLLLIEFLVGYWLKVFPFKRKAYLILYDRYFIDVLADPLRYRIKGNKLFIKMIHHILPQPDMWIILDLSTKVLLQRKQELTYEMSEKLRQEYLNLQKILSNCVVINNENEIQNTVDKATAHILNYMHRKLPKFS
ncbi:hypothetical protein ACFSRY_00395 [Pontibacter locisalis]|uniref:Thymidylate kinase n=1 Tax=Pontibacter locisalis TaxID=1719035 RepID=A0ABW5IH34_9BACT